MDQTLSFIVRDHRRHEFGTLEALRGLDPLTVAVPDAPYLVAAVREHVPHATVVPIPSPRTFFRQEDDEYDALVYAAEAGSAWTLVYPDYSVVVPQPATVRFPMVYPVRRGDREMLEFLNAWIELKRKDGTIQRLYDHWILGRDAERRQPRWSVIRNVLGWVD